MATKKELKEAYNLIKPKIGVFKVTNLVNGKIFIDSSVNLDKIWNRHRVELNFGNHRNESLQKDNFRYQILSEIKQSDDQQADYAREAKKLAAMFMEELQPYGDNGYNQQHSSQI